MRHVWLYSQHVAKVVIQKCIASEGNSNHSIGDAVEKASKIAYLELLDVQETIDKNNLLKHFLNKSFGRIPDEFLRYFSRKPKFENKSGDLSTIKVIKVVSDNKSYITKDNRRRKSYDIGFFNNCLLAMICLYSYRTAN